MQQSSGLYDNSMQPLPAYRPKRSLNQPAATLEIGDKLKRDLKLIELRNFLDPKR
jgi:hypothetical protein